MNLDNDTKNTVLIIDDTVENLDILTNILKPYYNILAATSGQKAIKLLENVQPDIILLDIIMPEMSGYEVIEKIKSNEKTKSIPVIFVSSKGDVEDETKGFKLGASDYIIKPLSPPIIIARVESQITIFKQKKELQKRNEEMEKAIRVLENKLARFSPSESIIKLPITEKNHAKKQQNYFHEEHKRDLSQLIKEIDTSVSLILTKNIIEKDYIQNIGSKFLRYAEILIQYPAFQKVGNGMLNYAQVLLVENDINYTAEHFSFIIGCLESLTFTLERWQTQIFNGELEDPNIFDNSILADMQTIIMAYKNDF